MKKILNVIFIVLLFVFQTVAGRYIKVFNVLPNIALTYVIVYSITNSCSRAAFAGGVCGFIFDLCAHSMFGVCTILVMYVSILSSWIAGKFYYENKAVTISGVFISTIVYEFLYVFITRTIFGEIPVFYALGRYILIEAVLNLILSIPISFVVRWINSEYIRGI